MNQPLGDRMKENYEYRWRTLLPCRTYTIIRLDGNNFHRYTKDVGFIRPYDWRLRNVLVDSAIKLMKDIQGARLGYVQSDEVSILLTDFGTTYTEPWLDGNLQKVVSISASKFTAYFNSRAEGGPNPASFDARVFSIHDPTEVANYFVWRQQDCTRNSIQSLGRVYFSHKELIGKSCDEIQEMLFQVHEVNWNDCQDEFKRGTLISGGPLLRFQRPAQILTSEEGWENLNAQIPRYV